MLINIKVDITREATRILTLMGETVRQRRQVDTLELFLEWADYLSIEQFSKAVSYLRYAGVVGRVGDMLVWKGKRGVQ